MVITNPIHSMYTSNNQYIGVKPQEKQHYKTSLLVDPKGQGKSNVNNDIMLIHYLDLMPGDTAH